MRITSKAIKGLRAIASMYMYICVYMNIGLCVYQFERHIMILNMILSISANCLHICICVYLVSLVHQRLVIVYCTVFVWFFISIVLCCLVIFEN